MFSNGYDPLNMSLTIVHSVKEASRWDIIPVEDIEDAHAIIYDSPYRTECYIVDDLDSLPLLDSAGAEVAVYTAAGRRIPRRIPLFPASRKPAGILIDLERIRDFFVQPQVYVDDVDSDEGGRYSAYDRPDLFLYPQAFLKKHGHVQCNIVPIPVRQMLTELNHKVAMPITMDDDSDRDSDDSSEADVPLHFSRAVNGMSSQIYGNIMHRSRPTAAQHDAQLGTVSQAFGGSYSQGPANKRVAARTLKACLHQLPQEHFDQRIANVDIPTDLRLEYVCNITIANLRPQFRNGRCDQQFPLVLHDNYSNIPLPL